MDRTAAITKLKEHQAELKQLGVEHLYLFGSTARGEAREDSDVDLFFDHPLGSLGLFELMDVKDAAARILGRKTDIMTRRSLHPVLRERIEASALQVFRWPSLHPVPLLTARAREWRAFSCVCSGCKEGAPRPTATRVRLHSSCTPHYPEKRSKGLNVPDGSPDGLMVFLASGVLRALAVGSIFVSYRRRRVPK